MSIPKKLHSNYIKTINKFGNDGYIVAVKSKTVNGTQSVIQNSYDENGEELFDSTATTPINNDDHEIFKVKYVHKQLRVYESEENTDNAGMVRITCISTDSNQKDINRIRIQKSFEFKDFMNILYSIEEVHHLGQIKNREFALELIVKRK